MNTLLFAVDFTKGALNLLWMYLWLASAMSAAYLSERKGYGDRPGLATGLVLSVIGAIVWLIIPAKPESKWKNVGAFGRGNVQRSSN